MYPVDAIKVRIPKFSCLLHLRTCPDPQTCQSATGTNPHLLPHNRRECKLSTQPHRQYTVGSQTLSLRSLPPKERVLFGGALPVSHWVPVRKSSKNFLPLLCVGHGGT